VCVGGGGGFYGVFCFSILLGELGFFTVVFFNREKFNKKKKKFIH
jgi:hypothetical protein